MCILSHNYTFSKKSGKIKTSYKQDYVNVNCDVDFDFAGPTIHGAAVLGYGIQTITLLWPKVF